MRFTIVALGTRGDVTPFVALAIGLRADGHSVRIATHADFESTVRRHGIDFHGLPGSFQNLIASSEGRRALGVPNNSIYGLNGVLLPFRDCAEAVFAECWAATADADVILSSAIGRIVSELIAGKRDLPLILGLASPSLPTRRLPHPVFPPWRLGPLYNRATFWMAGRITQRARAELQGRWQREANRLDPGSARPLRGAILTAVSPIVVPRPPDWPAVAHLTGFWFLPADSKPAIPDSLRDFVDAGPPPLCLGFGSMSDDRPDELRSIVLEALQDLHMRAVVVTGSGAALGDFKPHDNVHEVAFVDYRWLFPRVAAVVHQGGIGTASYCLTSGVPQVVVGYCLDHRFWGWRMHEIGVAPSALSRQTVTAKSLANAVRETLSDATFRSNASSIARSMAAEDGVANAVRILNDHLAAAAKG